MVVPSPAERQWLARKYPGSWPSVQTAWEQVDARWQEREPGNDLGVMGTSIIGFCELCQLVLCGGTPARNSAIFTEHEGQKKVFCSEPCRWIFEQEPARYASHKNVVKRVLAGEAPANLLEMLTRYFGLTEAGWGPDLFGGEYPWIQRPAAGSRP